MNSKLISLLRKGAELNQNVLLSGKHGIGKTAVIKEIFTEKFGNDWLYFSAATMDPWVDFVGIPRETKDEHGHYVELVRPKYFRDDSVKAIFFDEFNRAPKKVKNAVMELIQFKSINGKKFNNLQVIWAAINPDDAQETYDVERIDPAQLDRFQIKIDIPYLPDVDYFSKKFGRSGELAIKWWKGLTGENRELVSPRRLEYAIELIQAGFPIAENVIDAKCNPSELLRFLNETDISSLLGKAIKANDVAKIRELLQNPSCIVSSKQVIVSNQRWLEDNQLLLPEYRKALHLKPLTGNVSDRATKYKMEFGLAGKPMFEDPTLSRDTYTKLQKKYIGKILFRRLRRTDEEIKNNTSLETAFKDFVDEMQKAYGTATKF